MVLFYLIVLNSGVSWCITCFKILPVLSKHRDLTWTDFMSGPNQQFVFKEYRGICIREGYPLNWATAMKLLIIGQVVFILFWILI